MSTRAIDLAERLELGAKALASFAHSLSDGEWRTLVPPDGRPVGAIVHHVASVYPLEMQLAQTVAAGKAIVGVTSGGVADMNAKHAHDHGDATREETVALLLKNSKVAADALRVLTDEELDRAAPVSLYFDAPLTCQFMLEDHAVRHSYHHLGRIRAALGR